MNIFFSFRARSANLTIVSTCQRYCHGFCIARIRSRKNACQLNALQVKQMLEKLPTILLLSFTVAIWRSNELLSQRGAPSCGRYLNPWFIAKFYQDAADWTRMFSAECLPPCTASHYEKCRNANCTFIFQKSSNSKHKRSAEIICFLCAAVIRNR